MVAGLGNPGKQYDKTRHNAGFCALDYLAGETGVRVAQSKFEALCGQGEIAGEKVLLMKPQTFMNLSGRAVAKAAAFYKIPPEHCIILFDDISLPPGRLRIRAEGSAGGHNGIKSIIGEIGPAFPRIKIGVGERPRREIDLADWVLGRLTGEEQKTIEARYPDILGAAEHIIRGDIAGAMSRYNG